VSGVVIHGLVRRALFLYLLFVLLGVQVTFLLTAALGVDFEPVSATWVLTCFLPVALMAVRVAAERGRLATFALPPWPLWAVLGPVMFGFWSGGYFLVGLLTDPDRATHLTPVLDRFIPFKPSFVFIYLNVYPLFLMPFVCARRAATIHRVIAGSVVMLVVSYAFFLAMPVSFDRPALPEPPPDFSTWVLLMVVTVHPSLCGAS